MGRSVFYKLLALLLLVSLVLGMTACDKKRKKDTTTTTTSTTTASTTTASPLDTPEEIVAAGMASSGVYEVYEMSDFSETVYYLSVAEEGWVYFLEGGQYAYHDLSDAGYVVIDGEAYRMSGALYADYSRLWRESIFAAIPRIDLDGAEMYTAWGETHIETDEWSLSYEVQGTEARLTSAWFYPDGGSYIGIMESEQDAPALPATYRDCSAALPTMLALLTLEDTPFTLEGEITLPTEAGDVTLSVLEGSLSNREQNSYRYAFSLTGADGTAMELTLLCDGTTSALSMGETVMTVGQEDSALLLYLLLSYAGGEEFPEMPAALVVTLPMEDGSVQILLVAEDTEDTPALSVSVGQTGALTFTSSAASAGAGALTVTPAATVPAVTVPTEAPVFVDLSAALLLTEAMAGNALYSEDGSVGYEGSLDLGYGDFTLCQISYDALISGETGDLVMTLRIPYVLAVTDGGMASLVPAGRVLIGGSTVTYLYAVGDTVYLKKVLSATYMESLTSSKTVSSTTCYKLSSEAFGANADTLIPWMLNVDFDSMATMSLGRAEMLLGAEQSKVYVGQSGQTVTVRADLGALTEMYNSLPDVEPIRLPEMLWGSKLTLEARVTAALDGGFASFAALESLSLQLTMAQGVYMELSAEPVATTASEVAEQIPDGLATDPVYLSYGE